jgi:hypothetical protein
MLSRDLQVITRILSHSKVKVKIYVQYIKNKLCEFTKLRKFFNFSA